MLLTGVVVVRIIVAIVACLVVLAGCAQERQRCQAYHFDSSFPAAYREAAATALERFSAFSGSTVVLEDGDGDACALRAISTSSPEYASRSAEMGTGWMAYHDSRTGSITLAEEAWRTDDYCTEDLDACATSILMHETAHEYGLQHVEDPEAVMGTTNPRPRHAFNASDFAELRRARLEQ